MGNSKTKTKLLNLNSFNYISNVKGDSMKSKTATTWVRVDTGDKVIQYRYKHTKNSANDITDIVDAN